MKGNPVNKSLAGRCWPVILLLWLLQPGVVAAQSFSVPVKFKVVDGNYDESQILVQRNGTTSQTIPGKERLTLELAYNTSYIISFTKPGYITKKISIDTHVPADRIGQGFEPYNYGVNLFKQYDGINTVIFNQPVAKIAFSKRIDDFDYDVDYTKSIQSAMKEAEEATEQHTAQLKKEEAQKLAAEKQKAADDLKLKKEEDKKLAEELKKKQADELAAKKAADELEQLEEKKHRAEAKEAASKNKPPPAGSGEDKKKTAEAAGGTDVRPANNPAAGGDVVVNVMKPGSGADTPPGSGVRSGADVAVSKAYMVSGSDPAPQPKSFRTAGTTEKPVPKAGGAINDGGFTVEEITQANRTITKVTIRNEDGTNVYTKVAYTWGGIYYFRNERLSIPGYIYFLYTKMK